MPTFEEELLELENQHADTTDLDDMISAYELRLMALKEQQNNA